MKYNNPKLVAADEDSQDKVRASAKIYRRKTTMNKIQKNRKRKD